MNHSQFSNSDYIQLLKRPRELPDFVGDESGTNAVWRCKVVYWRIRKKLIPRVVYKGTVKIQYSNLHLEGFVPPFKTTIPLVSICYVEADEKKNSLSVRGRWFTVEMYGISNILETQEWLRFLIIRQRIPHCILGKKFDWEDDRGKNGSNNNQIENKIVHDDNISIYDNLSVTSLPKFPMSLKKSILACLPFIDNKLLQ
uniref:PH domain-containing protein n=1 Tax=Strongyloides papillosus TaxID=174720 RepID=A0A0N5CFH8_STREA